MKNILSFIVCSILLFPVCEGQVLDAINLKCNDTLSVAIPELGATICIGAITYPHAQWLVKKAIMDAMTSDINCSNEDCPSQPSHELLSCSKKVFEELPVPTITPAGGDSLQFCFTFSDTNFDIGCDDCKYRRKYSYQGSSRNSLDKSQNAIVNTNDLYLAPNPTEGQLTIFYSLTHASDLFFRIINRRGQVVGTFQQTQVQAGKHDKQVDLSNLSSGIYFVQLLSKDGNLANTRFVKK